MRPDVAAAIDNLYTLLHALWLEASGTNTDPDELFALHGRIEDMHAQVGECIRDLSRDPAGAADDALACLRNLERNTHAELAEVRGAALSPA